MAVLPWVPSRAASDGGEDSGLGVASLRPVPSVPGPFGAHPMSPTVPHYWTSDSCTVMPLGLEPLDSQ